MARKFWIEDAAGDIHPYRNKRVVKGSVTLGDGQYAYNPKKTRRVPYYPIWGLGLIKRWHILALYREDDKAQIDLFASDEFKSGLDDGLSAHFVRTLLIEKTADELAGKTKPEWLILVAAFAGVIIGAVIVFVSMGGHL